MPAKHRPSWRVASAVVLLLLFIVTAAAGPPVAGYASQAAPATALDGALRAGDLERARRLVPENWSSAEQLFVSYLERAFLSTDPLRPEVDARTQAGRLADVFFRMVEYDFARAVVNALDTADRPKREALIAVVRDYHATLERTRQYSAPYEPPPGMSARESSQRRMAISRQIAGDFTSAADRFRVLSCVRCELHALRSMLNVGGAPQPRTDRVADQLGDELSLVRKLPYTETSLRMAERLELPRLQCSILESLGGLTAASLADPKRLEQAAKHLEQARVVWRRIPSGEMTSYWLAPSPTPRPAQFTLPNLWSIYLRLKRPAADVQPLITEAVEIARPFGEAAILSTLSAFASRSATIGADAAESVVTVSRPLGQKAELAALRAASGSGSAFKSAMGERALALAVTMTDAHERAVALEWFASTAAGGRTCEPFPPAYDELLRLCLKSDETALVTDALAGEGDCRLKNGDHAAALQTYNRAIEHAERAGDWAKAAQTANRATNSRPGPNLSPAARHELATRAIEDARKAGNTLELVKGLRARSQAPIGATHQSFEDIKAAVAAAEQYTEQSGSPQEELDCLRSLAAEHELRREFQAAVDAQRRRADLSHRFEAAAPNSHEIQAYEELARIYAENLGEPTQAYEAAERVRQILEASVFAAERPASPASYADAYIRLAETSARIGQSVTALEYWDKALAKAAESPASAPPQSSMAPVAERRTFTGRAVQYAKLGDFEAALNDLAQVGTLISRTRGNYVASETMQRANWAADVAWIEMKAGRPEKALASARDAVALCRQDPANLWPGAETLERLVDIFVATGHAQEAISFLAAVRESTRRGALDQSTLERWLLEKLARAHQAAGQRDQARSLLLSAADIDRRNPTAEAGGLGGSLLALGLLEIDAGNDARARECLREARAAVNPYDLERIWQIERALATLARRAGNAADASRHYDAAITALESVREQLRPEEFRLKHGFDRLALYEDHAALLAASALRSGRPADAELAFQAAERKRTQILWGLLSTGWSRITPAAVPDQLRRLSEAENRIGAKQSLLRQQYEQPPARRDAALVESLLRDLKQLQDDHARVLASVAQGQYRYAAPSALAAALAGPVRAALGPSRVLVEYLVTRERSYAFVVSGTGVKVVPLSLGRDRLREQVRALLDPFRRLRAGELDLARLTFDTRSAFALHQAIFAPLRAALGSAADIVIVPDDVLTFLPFDALVEQAPRAQAAGPVLHAELAGERFLIHRYAISYLSSSAQLLGGPGDAAAIQRAPKRFFAMANPATGRATAPTAASQDDPLKRQLRSGSFDAFLAPLPGAQSEVQRIARHFPADASVIITGAAATEAAYDSQAGEYGVVHFATHAVASDGQPFYSTMILAPDAAPGHDGFLQAFEVLRTPLRAELVVLSGCEAALGGEDLGQGLVGLVAAFQQAGARSVMATLWSIDEATAEMMAGFYGAMAKGASASAALRQAKLQMLQQRLRMGNAEVSLAHPFFWAPFILVGAPAGK